MMQGELPPDPENMNGKRAKWAEAAIRKFQIVTGADWDDCVKDLLCDLMHFCDRNTFQDGETSFDFEAALATARMHCEAETAPDTTPKHKCRVSRRTA